MSTARNHFRISPHIYAKDSEKHSLSRLRFESPKAGDNHLPIIARSSYFFNDFPRERGPPTAQPSSDLKRYVCVCRFLGQTVAGAGALSGRRKCLNTKAAAPLTMVVSPRNTPVQEDSATDQQFSIVVPLRIPLDLSLPIALKLLLRGD